MPNIEKDELSKAVYADCCKNSIDMKLFKLGVPDHLPVRVYDRITKKHRPKISEETMKMLPELFDEAVNSVKRYDDLIATLKHQRNVALEAAMAVRNSYVPDGNEEIKELAKLDIEKDGGYAKAEKLLAKLVGEDAVKVMANIYLSTDKNTDCLNVQFGIKSRPTMCMLMIPMEVNYSERYDVCKVFDDFYGGMDGRSYDNRSHIGVDEVSEREMRVKMRIAMGASGKYEATEVVKTLKDAGEDIVRLCQLDARDSLKDFGGIENVKTAKEFAEWRGRRFADKHARMNGVK